jgi:hypothetical protein
MTSATNVVTRSLNESSTRMIFIDSIIKIVKTLSEQRKKIFAANSNLKATLRKEAETRVFGGECTVESRGKELERKFHSYNLEGQPSLTNYRIEL